MRKSDQKIAEAIILAQVASDGGKWDPYTLNSISTIYLYKRAKTAYYRGYAVKAQYVVNAIRGINKSKDSMFRYNIQFAKDQNGYDSILVYFEWKQYGRRKQVSFHIVPREWTREMILLVSHCTRHTEWNRVRGGSQEDCINLAYLLKEVML